VDAGSCPNKAELALLMRQTGDVSSRLRALDDRTLNWVSENRLAARALLGLLALLLSVGLLPSTYDVWVGIALFFLLARPFIEYRAKSYNEPSE
jgi:hypothetical protein